MLNVKAKLFAPAAAAFAEVDDDIIAGDALLLFRARNWDAARTYITGVYESLYPGKQVDYTISDIEGSEE